MNSYQYQRRYRGLLIVSHFKMTDQLCHDYLDAYLEDPDRPAVMTRLTIDDPAPYLQASKDQLNDDIMEAKTVGELIQALKLLPNAMPFTQGYGSLYVHRGSPYEGSVHHLRTELFNND